MLRMYQGSDELHEKLQSVKDFVTFHHIPKPLANRLQESFQHNWAYTNGIDMNNVRISNIAMLLGLGLLTSRLEADSSVYLDKCSKPRTCVCAQQHVNSNCTVPKHLTVAFEKQQQQQQKTRPRALLTLSLKCTS